MDFTPLVPCGKTPSVACDSYIATICLPTRVIIRSTTSLSIKRVINIETTFKLATAQLFWKVSEVDGHHRLMLADCKTVLAYDMEDEEWSINISEGLGGVRHVEWSDTGREILVWAEFQLKMTVWSVMAATGTIIPNPKLLSKGFHTRPGRQQAALLQRTSQDVLAIIDTSTSEWQIQTSFQLATSDAQGVRWSPDGNWLAVWDNIIEYRVLIYTADGRLVRSFVAFDVGLGIKTVAWSPTAEYLAIGSFDDKVRLLNTSSFSSCMELSHVTTIKSRQPGVWRQVQSSQASRFDEADLPISPPTVKSVGSEVLPRQGVGILSFSSNGYFLATRCDRMPTTLWIWSLREFSPVAILVQTHPIKQVHWMPNEAGELIFTCQSESVSENNALFSWNIDWPCPRIIPIPRDGFDIRWISIVEQSGEGEEETGVLIGSGDAFTIGYTAMDAPPEQEYAQMSIVQEEQEEEEQESESLVQTEHDSQARGSFSTSFDPQGSVIIHKPEDTQEALQRTSSML